MKEQDRLWPVIKAGFIKINADDMYNYYMTPIDDGSLEEFTQHVESVNNGNRNYFNFKLDYINLKGDKAYVMVSSDDVLLFGDTRINDDSIKEDIKSILNSKKDFWIPVNFDVKRCMQGNKRTVCSDPYKLFQYYLMRIGNPENVIIFRLKYNKL